MKTTTALTTLLVASAVTAGAVTTAGAALGDTAVTIGAPKAITAGQTAPFDAPGVRAIRRGTPVPAGYVLVGRTVSIDAGTGAAGAALRLSCPAGKVLRTLASTGAAGLRVDRDYLGKRSTDVMSLSRGGGTTSGTAYGVCR